MLDNLIKGSKIYHDHSDVLKDYEIRTKIKEIVLRNITDDKQLEAVHTKLMDTMFLKLFRNITSFRDEARINQLYVDYENHIKTYLKNIK